MRVAVLRCRNFPSFVTWEVPDAEALFTDDRMLIDAFARQGVVAESVVWTEPVDWDSYDVALIRSTWDYIDELEAFLQVLQTIENSTCLLFNGLDAVRWNSDKSYLLELSARGVSTVPTVRASHPDVVGWLAQFGEGAVVKPLLGVGASGVERFSVGAGLLQRLAESPDDVLVQPLVDSVLTEGELSFVFIAGEFSHALVKRPAAGDFRIQSIYGGTVEQLTPAPADLEQAEAIARTLPDDPLYARLDLVRIDGRLAVMELELIEPFLFFDHAPGAADRLASATIARATTP
jgi:glutathione synthase/RimK-type ligase-like ATP-grasp enzyme